MTLLRSETYDGVYQRHNNLSEYIRNEAVKLGYTLYPDNNLVKRASSLSAFSLPESVNAADIVRYARNQHYTLFAKGLGSSASRILRVGHMGWFHEEDAEHMLHVLKGISENFKM